MTMKRLRTPQISAWDHIAPALALSLTLIHVSYGIYNLQQTISSRWVGMIYFFTVGIMALYLAVSWRID